MDRHPNYRSIRVGDDFIQGNGELAILAQMVAPDESAVTYWGTTGGGPLPEQFREVYRWTAQQLRPDYQPIFASWPKTFQMEIDGLGQALFCHGTPRSETEIFTRLTSEERLKPLFENLSVSVVVCGHTHMQFDRKVGGIWVVNAGSVAKPKDGNPQACYVVLEVENGSLVVNFKRVPYDVERAAKAIEASEMPNDYAEMLRTGSG